MDLLTMLELRTNLLNILAKCSVTLVMTQLLRKGLFGCEMSVFKKVCSLTLECYNSVTVELIDRCIRRMQKGKASGPDDLGTEHFDRCSPFFSYASEISVSVNS